MGMRISGSTQMNEPLEILMGNLPLDARNFLDIEAILMVVVSLAIFLFPDGVFRLLCCY